MPPDAWTSSADSQLGRARAAVSPRPRYGAEDVATLLWQERGVMAGVFIGIALLGLVVALLIHTRYPAQASLLVRLGQEYVYQPRAGDAARGAIPEADQVLQSEVEILSSAQVKQRVVERLTLASLFPALANGYDAASPEERRRRISKAIDSIGRKLKITSAPGAPIVRLSYADTDPQRAALVLNTLLDEYLIYRRSVLLGAAAPLEDQRKAFEARLAQADAAYEIFLGSNNIGDFEAEKAALGQLAASLQQQKYTSDAQLSERQGRLGGLDAQARHIAPEIGLERDLVAQNKLLDLRVQREALLGRYKPDAAPVLDIDAQIAGLQRGVASGRLAGDGAGRIGVNPAYQALQTDRVQIVAEISALRRQSQALEGQIADVTDRQLRLARLEPQYQGLTLDRDVLRGNVRDFETKAQVTEAADAMAGESNDNISVIQHAVAPTQGASLREPVLVLSLALAIFTALCVGLLRMFLRPGLPTAGIAGRTLNLPVLATAGQKAAHAR